MADKRISVVIPFYNAEKTLELCLNSLCSQDIKPDEIILVDNGSNDSSKSIVHSFMDALGDSRIVYVGCEKKGPSAARNKGVSIAKGDWLLFTDSDCVPSPTWISDYIGHFDDKSIGAVAGCIEPYPPSNAVQRTLSLFTLPENQREVVHDDYTITQGLYPTANLAVKKEVFDLIGGFNEALYYGEDRELCYKIYEAGFKIKAVKNALVEHIHRTDLNGLIKQAFGYGTAQSYKLRHLSRGTILLHLPFVKINKKRPGKYVWIDFNQADKKLFLCLLLGLIWWPLYSVAFAYVVYLCFFVHKKSLEKRIKTKLTELPPIVLLLILKSLFMTFGRISRSFKHRVICV